MLVGLSFTLIDGWWLGVFDFSCLVVRVMIAALAYVVCMLVCYCFGFTIWYLFV